MSRPRFRNVIMKLAPPWLTEGDGGKVLASIGIMCDAFAERMRQSLLARFPQYAPSDALPRIGRDRRIVRGINEPDATYAARLVQSIDDWRVAGNPWALMRQISGYVGPVVNGTDLGTNLRIRTVDNTGNYYLVDYDGSHSRSFAAGNWDWDGHPEKWSRFWVGILPPTSLWEAGPTLGDPDLWGGALGIDGYTVGSTATPEQVRAIKQIANMWKPAGTRCVRVVVMFTDSFFDPNSTQPPNPDGDWDIPSNRAADAAFWNPNT